MVTLLGVRAAATTKSLAARGRNFGTLLRRNAARRWKKLRRSKVSLDGQRSKTSACEFHQLLPTESRKGRKVRVFIAGDDETAKAEVSGLVKR
jgi:hypothetical protein